MHFGKNRKIKKENQEDLENSWLWVDQNGEVRFHIADPNVVEQGFDDDDDDDDTRKHTRFTWVRCKYMLKCWLLNHP